MGVSASALKFAPVTGMSFSAARAKDWDDLLTAHKDESVGRTWSVQNLRLGKHTFKFPTPSSAAVTVRILPASV